jgi:hypothetical protein
MLCKGNGPQIVRLMNTFTKPAKYDYIIYNCQSFKVELFDNNVHSYENKYIEYVGQQAVDELTEKISVSDR